MWFGIGNLFKWPNWTNDNSTGVHFHENSISHKFYTRYREHFNRLLHLQRKQRITLLFAVTNLVRNMLYALFLLGPPTEQFCFFYLGHFRRLPFDWRTPFGYSLALLFECVTLFYLCSMMIPQLCVALGASWWVDIYVNRIIHKLNNLNVVLRSGSQAHQEDYSLIHPIEPRDFHNIAQSISQVKQFSSNYEW